MRQREIVAASVILGFSFLLAMALVAWFLTRRHRRKKTAEHISPEELNEYSVDGEGSATPLSAFVTARSWKEKVELKRRSTAQSESPSLATFLKAGDEDIFGSDVFCAHNLRSNATISLDSLYDALANTMMARPAAQRLAYSRAMSQFIAGRKSSRKRRQSVPTTADWDKESSVRLMKTKRRKTSRSQYLVISTNSFPMTEEGAEPAGSYAWWEMRPTLGSGLDGELTLEISPEELAALSILLACGRPSSETKTPSEHPYLAFADTDVGAFGISIKWTPTSDRTVTVSLTRRPQDFSEQLSPTGSGHSILLAKHIACGSLPFSRGPCVTNGLLISRAAEEAVLAGSLGSHIEKRDKLNTVSATFLSRLPHSRPLALYELSIDTAITSATDASMTPAQLPEDFLEVLSRLPYTTLPPIASNPIISVIKFIASAGLPPGRLLQRLESLIEKVHNYSPGASLFGPLYEQQNIRALFREKERLGKLMLDSTPKGNVPDNLAQKTARLHRYGILMERLMGLLATGGLGKEEVRQRVNEATKIELLKSYTDALSSRFQTQSPQTSPAKEGNSAPATSVPQAPTPTVEPVTPSRNPSSAARSPQMQGTRTGTTHSSISSRRSGSTRRSGPSAPPNLGSHLEDTLKAGLPLSVPQVAFVGRLVLVAWSISVGKVAWEEGEEGMSFEILENEKMVMV